MQSILGEYGDKIMYNRDVIKLQREEDEIYHTICSQRKNAKTRHVWDTIER